MKNINSKLAVLIILFMHNDTGVKAQTFKPEQFVQSASIVLNGDIEKVFPLFGAMEEKKWAEGWNPSPVFPASGNMEEGFIFQSPDHIANSPLLTWVVAKFDSTGHQVKYIVNSTNRVTIISITCSKLPADRTQADITYQFTGLNEEGNEISHHLIAHMFKDNLKDWEEAINNYLVKSN